MQNKNFRTTLILSALVAFAPMSIDMYLPALPSLERYFATGTASVQHTLASFFLGLTVGQLLYGPIADRYGRKPPLYFGLALYVLVSAGCALVPSIGSLIVLRFLQALSGCVGMVVARAVVRDLYDHQESARVYSVLLMVMGIAPIVAPLAGGYLLAWLGWRSIFWVLALFGVACLIAVKAALPETIPRNMPRVPLSAALTNYASLLADRRYLGYALSGGFGQAGMFAYISGSPFVLIDLYGVPAHYYGWLLPERDRHRRFHADEPAFAAALRCRPRARLRQSRGLCHVRPAAGHGVDQCRGADRHARSAVFCGVAAWPDISKCIRRCDGAVSGKGRQRIGAAGERPVCHRRDGKCRRRPVP